MTTPMMTMTMQMKKFRQASILNVAEYDSLWWLETMAWDRYCDLLIRPKRL
jgi:hypothetical protein